MDQLHSLAQAPYLLDISCTSSLFWDLANAAILCNAFQDSKIPQTSEKEDCNHNKAKMILDASRAVLLKKQQQKNLSLSVWCFVLTMVSKHVCRVNQTWERF